MLRIVIVISLNKCMIRNDWKFTQLKYDIQDDKIKLKYNKIDARYVL